MPDPIDDKVYLGDGAYATFHDNSMKLTTENGMSATNTIFWEAEVFETFIREAAQRYDKERMIQLIEGHYP